MPQSSLVSWLFSWKRPKATPKAVVERAAVFGQLDFDNHRIEAMLGRIEELENDAAGKEARIDRLEQNLARLQERLPFA